MIHIHDNIQIHNRNGEVVDEPEGLVILTEEEQGLRDRQPDAFDRLVCLRLGTKRPAGGFVETNHYTVREDDDWKALIMEKFDLLELRNQVIENAEPDPDDEDTQIGRVYIGKVFTIMPSGKYYMPFACSNLERCPVCSGQGTRQNALASPALHAVYQDAQHALRMAIVREFGPACTSAWPAEPSKDLASLQAKVDKYQAHIQCPYCHGAGSHEADQDEAFMEAFKALLSEADLWLECGEGDPTDLVVVGTVEKDEETCE